MPVRRFLTSTLAPFTDAPDGSVTVPCMVPFVPCACKRIDEFPENVEIKKRTARPRHNLVCIIPFPGDALAFLTQNACKLKLAGSISPPLVEVKWDRVLRNSGIQGLFEREDRYQDVAGGLKMHASRTFTPVPAMPTEFQSS